LGVARKQGVGGGTLKELVLQYNVQVDVVTQLEGRVKQQIGSAQSGAPQIVKLKRDFERVQARVQSLKLDVDRMERLAAKSTSMTSTNAMTATGGGGGLTSNYSSTESYAEVASHNTGAQQQMQLQMQHDVSILYSRRVSRLLLLLFICSVLFCDAFWISDHLLACLLFIISLLYLQTASCGRNHERTGGRN